MTDEQRKKLSEVMTGLNKTMSELEPEGHIEFFIEFRDFTHKRLVEESEKFTQNAANIT